MSFKATVEDAMKDAVADAARAEAAAVSHEIVTSTFNKVVLNCYKEENNVLKKENDKLKKENDKLKKENDKLKNALNAFCTT